MIFQYLESWNLIALRGGRFIGKLRKVFKTAFNLTYVDVYYCRSQIS